MAGMVSPCETTYSVTDVSVSLEVEWFVTSLHLLKLSFSFLLIELFPRRTKTSFFLVSRLF